MSQQEESGFNVVAAGILLGAVLYIVGAATLCMMGSLNKKAVEQVKKSSVERRRHNELIRTIEESGQ